MNKVDGAGAMPRDALEPGHRPGIGPSSDTGMLLGGHTPVSKNHHFTLKVLHLEFEAKRWECQHEDECKHCVDSAEFHLLRS